MYLILNCYLACMCTDTESDDDDQVRAVRALSAIFTVLAKKDKERAPLHYWLQDYEVHLHIHICNMKYYSSCY